MIQKQSNDPDVEQAAAETLAIINTTLAKLPKAEAFDYGGHKLKIGEYGVCEYCTTAIAEAQAAEQVLRTEIDLLDDPTVKEHLELAAKLFHLDAEAAIVRAEFHNGHDTEQILNKLLAFEYERRIGENYNHSHEGNES